MGSKKTLKTGDPGQSLPRWMNVWWRGAVPSKISVRNLRHVGAKCVLREQVMRQRWAVGENRGCQSHGRRKGCRCSSILNQEIASAMPQRALYPEGDRYPTGGFKQGGT